MESIHRLAAAENLSVGEYVRRALREVENSRPTRTASAKLAAIREAVTFNFPSGDIRDMNREIERGYQS